MQTFNAKILQQFFALAFAGSLAFAQPAFSQNETASTAIDAAAGMANMLDGSRGGVSQGAYLASLEAGAAAGEPIALWRLGVMYENGDGVNKDTVKAFGYFSRIANDYANTPPKSLQADIVAQSFVKVGDYYRSGLPDAGIGINNNRFHALLLHAASYFGDADAQYRVGRLYLDEDEMGVNPVQSARWLSLAAHKGHVAAQAALGDLLFNNGESETQKLEGLMWLSLAGKRAKGSSQELWIAGLRDQAMSIASSEQRLTAINAADNFGARFDN